MTTTILLTVSRDDFLTEVLSSLELLDCDQSYTNILCVVDGDAKMFTKVRNLIQNTKFNERLTVQYPDRKTVKRFDTNFRRKRIAQIHQWAKQHISDISNFVFITEDDTIVPRDTLKKLTNHLYNNQGVAMVEGVQVGRWGISHVGVWKFDDIYEPTSVTSLEVKDSGVEYIDAGGFYCSLIRTPVYKNHDFILYETLGPDVSMGLITRQDGYMNMVDWSVKCKHLNITKSGDKETLYPDTSVGTVTIRRKPSAQPSWSVY